MSGAHEASDKDQRSSQRRVRRLASEVEVRSQLCVKGLCIPTVDVAGEEYVAFPLRKCTWLKGVLGGWKGARDLPSTNILTEISEAVKNRRGKPMRQLAIPSASGEAVLQFEISVRGHTLMVANMAWPVHVAATASAVTTVLNELRKDLRGPRRRWFHFLVGVASGPTKSVLLFDSYRFNNYQVPCCNLLYDLVSDTAPDQVSSIPCTTCEMNR